MRFIAGAGCEIKGVSVPGRDTVAERERPQAIDGDGVAARIAQRTDGGAAGGKCVDAPVAKVADENIAAEATEIGRALTNAPRRIERAATGEAVEQVSVE